MRAIGAPPAMVDHCYARNVRHEWNNPDDSTTKAVVSARKSGINRKSLIHINAHADQYGRPLDGPWLQTPTTPIAATKIKVLGWWLFGRHLDPSGDLYLALPDNEVKDLNLRVPGVKHYGAWATGTKLRLELDSMTFVGNGDIQKDDGTGAYSAPHWQTNDASGTVTSQPVMYVSGSSVQTSTEFKLTGNGSFPVIVKGKVSGGATSFTLWGTNDTPTGPICGFYLYPDNPLTANRIDFFNPMKIKWQYSSKSKLDFLDAGMSTNQVYVTLRAPTNSVTLFHTVVHLACYHTGATADAQAVANTWDFFAGKNVATWDGTPLTYYATHNGDDCYGTACLLAGHEGQCGSFASLFRDSLAANGIFAAITEVTPPAGFGGLGVRKIIFSGPSSTPPLPYLDTDLDLSDADLPGQNTAPPQAKLFNLHYIVHHIPTALYYDASYGKTANTDSSYSAGALDAVGNAYLDRWRPATNDVLRFNDF